MQINFQLLQKNDQGVHELVKGSGYFGDVADVSEKTELNLAEPCSGLKFTLTGENILTADMDSMKSDFSRSTFFPKDSHTHQLEFLPAEDPSIKWALKDYIDYLTSEMASEKNIRKDEMYLIAAISPGNLNAVIGFNGDEAQVQMVEPERYSQMRLELGLF